MRKKPKNPGIPYKFCIPRVFVNFIHPVVNISIGSCMISEM